MTGKYRFDLTKAAPSALKAFYEIENEIKASKFDQSLKHLVKLRVSQINGCPYGVEMHTREARADNETQKRLDHLVVWRQVDMFTDTEKAALAWAEALTTKGQAISLGDLHTDLQSHFDHDNIALLTLSIIMINNWDRLQFAAAYNFF